MGCFGCDEGNVVVVWGMADPPLGGVYGPYGDEEGTVDNFGNGWRHRLKSYYADQTPERQKQLFLHPSSPGLSAHSYPGYVVDKFVGEIGTKISNSPDSVALTPILEHEPPRFFATEKGFDALASIIGLCNRICAVDEAMKPIIERLEPGIHQFFPLEIRMPRGKVYPVPYFTLAVGNHLDSLVPDKCKEGVLRPDGPDHYLADGSKKGISGRAFAKAKFGDAHLWRERHFGALLTCFSDALQAEIERAGLLIPKHYKMLEV